MEESLKPMALFIIMRYVWNIVRSKLKKRIEVSVRIHTPAHGLWSKYGISLQSLRKFWEEASKYPFLKLNGIHFHQSRNKTVSFYVNTIRDLANYLKENFTSGQLKSVALVDFGGGFERILAAIENTTFLP